MEELRDLLDMDTSSKDIYVREDDKGNTGTMRSLSVKLPVILSYILVYLHPKVTQPEPCYHCVCIYLKSIHVCTNCDD